MSALRRLFELIVLLSVGAIALCAGRTDSPAVRDEGREFCKSVTNVLQVTPVSQSAPSRNRAGDRA